VRPLVLLQWRLVATTVYLWTLASLVTGPVLEDFVIGSELTPGLALFLTMLSTGLGGKLFSEDAASVQGVYLRSLPVSARRLFWTKVGVGLAAIGAAFALHLVYWYSGLAALWQGIVKGGFGVLYLAPLPWALPATFLWCVFCFAASAYFACSFERVGAARQAGVPGWAVGFVVAALFAQGLDVESAWPFVLTLAAVIPVALLAAERFFARRGVGVATPREPTQRGPERTALPWVVAAQLALVVAPLATIVHLVGSAPEPWPSRVDLLWPGLGIALLPWSVRQVRARGLSGPRAAGILLLNLTGLGALVWTKVRSRGPAARCAGCGRRRQVSFARCPHCARERRYVAIERERAGTLGVPHMPGAIAVFGLLALVAWELTLGRLQLVQELEIETHDPWAEIRLNGEPWGTTRVRTRRLRAEPTVAAAARWSGTQGHADLEATSEVGVGELARALQEAPISDGTVADCARELELAGLRPTDRIGFVAGTVELVVQGVLFSADADDGVRRFTVRFDLRHPLREELLGRYAELLAGGAPPDRARLAALVPFTELLAYWAPELDATPLVRLRYGVEGPTDGAGARIWDELLETAGRVTPALDADADEAALRKHLETLHAPLLALALLEGPDAGWLRRRIAEREPYALLAAGLSGRSELFEACRAAFEARRNVRFLRKRDVRYGADPARLAAGWALAAIDGERAAPIVGRAVLAGDPLAVLLLPICPPGTVPPDVRGLARSGAAYLSRRFRLAEDGAVTGLRERLRFAPIEPRSWLTE